MSIEALKGFLGIQAYWPKPLRDTGYFLQISKGIQDTWINFRDMGIQCFLNFGDICHISFKDMGHFSK